MVTTWSPIVIPPAFTVPALPSSSTNVLPLPVDTLPSLPLIITVVSPAVPLLKVVSPFALNSTLPLPALLVMLVILPRSLFKDTVIVVFPSAFTRILPLADLKSSTLSLSTPSPTMFTTVFKRCLFTVSELLPAKRKPSSMVAT